MPVRKHNIRRKSRGSRRPREVTPNKVVEPVPVTPDFHHKFLVDEGSGNNSPLYYILIFFTLFLILAAVYAGVDSYQRLSVGKIDSFDKCLAHPRSIVQESNPRLCTTLDSRTYFEQIVNKETEIGDAPEDIYNEYQLKLPDSWKVKMVGYDSRDKPTIWLAPVQDDYTDNFRFPHEVILGGDGVMFVDGEVCASTTCEMDSDGTITFDGVDYPIKIFTDRSSSPDISRHTFQFKVKDDYDGFYISANYYNLDQYTSIQELLNEINIDEVNEMFDNLYMGFED